MTTSEYFEYFHHLDNSLQDRIMISGSNDDVPVIDFARILELMEEKMGQYEEFEPEITEPESFDDGAEPSFEQMLEFVPEPEGAEDFDKYLGEPEISGGAEKIQQLPMEDESPEDVQFEDLIVDAENTFDDISGGGLDDFDSFLVV